MTPFEIGYEGFLRGAGAAENPFDPESSPYSHKRWLEGWQSARKSKMEKMV